MVLCLLVFTSIVAGLEPDQNQKITGEKESSILNLNYWGLTHSFAQEMDLGRVDYSRAEYQNLIPEQSCGCVAFRFDDIQNGWLDYPQIEVITKFREKDLPLTIGILGNEFRGYMGTYVEQITNEEDSKIELANHGWKHEDFTILDKETQSQLMEQTNKRIAEITGKSPKIFVPPFNVFNDDTLEAVEENGFTHFSPSAIYSAPPYPLTNSDVYNFPETSTTGIITPGLGLFEGISHIETMKDIHSSQKFFGFSVVTLHPQEFSVIENGAYTNQVNEKQMKELDLLIEEIQKSNLKIIFLSQINENVIGTLKDKETNPPTIGSENQDKTGQKIPDWIRNIFVWYADGQIEEEEVLQAIKFLINEKIIKIE